LASVTLTPMLCAVLLKDPTQLRGPFPKIASVMDRLLAWIVAQYRWFFERMIRRPLVTTILCIAFFLTIVYPAKRLGSEFVPKSDRDVFVASVLMPDGTPVERTDETIAVIDRLVKEFPEVE